MKIFNISSSILIALALLLSACSGTQPPAATESQLPAATESVAVEQAPSDSATGLDACALLTRADAEEILGQPVGEPEFPIQGSATFNVSSCKYRLQADRFTSVYVITTVPLNGSVESAQVAFNTDKTQALEMLGAPPVEIPALGDSAYWVGGMGNQIGILTGNTHLIISASTQTGDVPPQPMIDLAAQILDRLP